MIKQILSITIIAILTLSITTAANFADAQNNKVNVLIGFHGIPDDSFVKGNGGEIKKNFHPFINVIAANIPEAAINGLMKNPNVSFVEEDATATIQGHSTSAGGEYARSWGVDHIDADVVHQVQVPNTGVGINVAVIDTGVNYDHLDLSANYKGGIDIRNDDTDPDDDHGHGSHVAGILAAVAGNEEVIEGVIGTAPGANIYGVKVLSSSGSGSYSDIISGIQWSSDNGMNVASLSLGGGASQALCDAVTAAYIKGVLVIAAAGNSGNPPGKGDNVLYPANCDDAIAVAATNQDDNRASFSSTGPQVEISAPGVSIYSTHLDQNYKTFSGTSMATPHVSGVAALVFASGSYSNQDVRTILQETANDLGPSGRDSKYGFGLVNPVDAVDYVTSPISNILANPSSTSATITWTTDEAATSRVDYGLDISYGSFVFDPTSDTSHNIELTGLSSSTTYHFKVTSVDSSGNSASSGDLTFNTTAPDDDEPKPCPRGQARQGKC